MRISRHLAHIVLLPLLLAAGMTLMAGVNADLRAQEESVRDGLWFNVGLGYGSLGCQDCSTREAGLSGGLAFGGAITPRVLLGVGTNGWTRSENGVRLTAGTLTILARFYLSDTGGFHFLAGLGLGGVDLDISGLGSTSETGAGAVLGLGYDVILSDAASLTLFWNGMGINYDGGDANVGQLGIGLTFH